MSIVLDSLDSGYMAEYHDGRGTGACEDKVFTSFRTG
jgi:hypothetical protein